MKCKRCETLPEVEEKSVRIYVYIPTHHHEPLFEYMLDEKGYAHTKHPQYYLIEAGRFSEFIHRMTPIFNSLERQDVKILPFSHSDGLTPEALHNMRTLAEWMDFYQAREIRYVLKTMNLKVMFQPIIDMKTDTVYAYEGLVRGIDHDGSDIPPNKLFDQAKNLDLLFNLDKACREKVIEAAAQKNIECRLFINFIPTAIYNPELCLKTTEDAIRKYGLKASHITFEVVESERIKDFDHLNTILNHYRNRGMKTALDDVGSGFATTESIMNLKPDIIKLYASIIRHIDSDKKKQKRFKHYMKTAKKKGIKILAEGVETEEEATFVRNHSVDYAQGYYFARPSENI
ncbi:MAG: EAL domain-containing protein [Candidatus Izemoplasmataceae bacterium]